MTSLDPAMKLSDKALAPCPFCGKAMMLRGALWPSEGDRDAVIHAEPTDCPLYDFSNDTADESIIEVWNRRASPALPSSDLVERLERRAATMNGCHPVGFGDGNTYTTGYYTVPDANLDREAATALTAKDARIAELEEVLRSFVFGDSDIADILWGDLPDDASMKTTAPLGAYRRARRALASIRGGDEPHLCPICAEPFKADDTCATDIELGICHAACLEGSPVVDLETGEPVDGAATTYRYGGDNA